MDSNGDGVGDLKGVMEKIDYLADLGVDAIWLSPFCTSPMEDFGYDVTDYCDVDPIFGTLADFDALVEAAHRRGLKIVMDQVISHTASAHPWFVESRRDATNSKNDWYVWADPKPDGSPPNNWLSVFGGSAWEWNARRMQYYFHNFLKSQPDLNFHNPAVRAALLDVFRFWLGRGVDGFRLDTVNFYYHDKMLRDNPALPSDIEFATAPKTNPYAFQDHIYDKTRPENLEFLAELRKLMDSHPDGMLVGELGVDGPTVGPSLAAYTEKDKRLHMAYVFELLTPAFSARHIREVAENLTREIGDGWICWSFGNHDVERVISRWRLEKNADRAAPLLFALLLSLRGSACVYQGEELGLTEADIPFELIRDPYGKPLWPEFKGRDGCRTPMPWRKESAHAGFTTGTPWLPVDNAHLHRAVDAEERDPQSPLSRCRAFARWRKGYPVFRGGSMTFLDTSGDVLCFVREDGGKKVLAAFNLGGGDAVVSLGGAEPRPLFGHGFNGRIEGGDIFLGGFDAAFCEL